MSRSSLAGKVAVVTGASRGIGAAIARRLAADGAKVVVNYRKSARAADRVVADITAAGGEAIAVQADVADRAQVARLFADAEAAYGRLDILVNNAGTAEPAPLDGMTDATMGAQFAVNLRGTVHATQEAARATRGTDAGGAGGRIVNISTIAAEQEHTPAGLGIYGASKAAVEALTASLARALARTPLGRLGRPEDVANAVAFLASDDAAFITGQSLAVSGGAAL
ncbi:beta-ketoacyl-ACP reductase [Gemmatimonadetes bacterium T265]|nr:beta-ketoacyl-ACP reductase [Gemmatimonadetes bacterium T265]